MEELKKTDGTKNKNRQINLAWFGLAMFLLGALSLVVFRFATLKDDSVHHHANFALYINGKQDEFKSFTFYEEVAACAAEDPDDIKGRVHMHDQKGGLVHVHAHAVTWGQFFTNIGYTLGNKVIVTDDGVYADGQDGNKLTFLLNGQNTQTIQDQIIKSEDVLLISYGKEDEKTLTDRYQTVPNDAKTANTKPDPAACSGAHELSFSERLKQSIGLPAPSK